MSETADDPKTVFLATMARELHRAGLATDALESTLLGVANAIQIDVQVFALPTNITLGVGPFLDQKVVMMRLEPGRVNLRKIALLNLIYDDLQAGKIDYREAAILLSTMDRRWPGINAAWDVPALALVAGGVGILLGANVREVVVAACIGAFSGIISVAAARIVVIARLYEVIAAFGSTLIVAAFTHFFGPINIYVSIVAGVVVLLPGYSLTLALHELANGDLVAGVARLGKVLSVLLALGCGAFLGFATIGPSILQTADTHTHAVASRYWIVAAVAMATGLSVDLDARLHDFVWVFASSFVALLASHLLGSTPVHQVAAFGAAFICGIVANLGARFLRIPQPVMLVPALLVLVPGSLSYESVLFAFQQNISTSLTFASNAAFAAIELVAGLLLSQLLFPTTALHARGGIGRFR
ncbi:MAG: threonine/serine exporter family protein [Candidatus Eremiobacteraeota bacterium]|nr:threonine/serine exporter family protein [Candidatus Eremiobacteraeota bacterium]